ncbi:MAG TPA: divalent-cation tolerance protein CutA [Alphaproteobacteria bacterium]|nr:divalent-cation tolerance protein CutA [Alphaproteobacteria bacterium]
MTAQAEIVMPEETGIVFIYVTAPSAEVAEHIAAAAVEEKLAACANILPGMTSVYRWQGKVERASEVVVILKTRADVSATLMQRIKTLHPYEVPCAVSLPVLGGLDDYLGWIKAETLAE